MDIRRKHAASGLLLWGLAMAAVPDANAQSSVTLGGFLDAGLAEYANSGGNTLYKFQNAGIFPTKIYFRGVEDLGGGTSAIFSLDSLITLATGAINAQSHGALFEDSAWVGLKQNGFGQVRLGEQNDFAFDDFLLGGIDTATGFAGGTFNQRTGSFGAALSGLSTPAQFAAANASSVPGNFAPIIGPTGTTTGYSAINWDRAGGTRMPNAVKFVSDGLYGVSVGAMYSFGGVAGGFSQDSGKSFSLKFDYAKTHLAAVYTEQNYQVLNSGKDGLSNVLIGGRTEIAGFNVGGMYSNARNTYTGAMVYSLSGGVTRVVFTTWKIGLAYTYENGNALLKNVAVNQAAFQITDELSTRTAVYLTGVWQRTNGAYPADIANTISSGNVASVVAVGLMHRF